MKFKKNFIDTLFHPSNMILFLDRKGIIRINDEMYLKLLYRKVFHKKLDLKDPKTFNEKLQWLKLNDRKDIYTTMVDKYEAKKYVAGIIGEEYIVPTLGIYEKFDDINFDKLPNQFVIKCTHDSGGIVIVKDKKHLNVAKAKKKINSCLKNNFFYNGREWPYKNVKPKILIEKYIEDKSTKELRDYKFFCFNGKVKYFKIDFNRFTKHQANYYDIEGNLQEFGEEFYPPDFNKKLDFPINLKEMMLFSEKLAKNTYFIRVDFYEVDKKIYFGELTFFPNSGYCEFYPIKWNQIWGDLINLKIKKGE